jgi:hypothetical protein
MSVNAFCVHTVIYRSSNFMFSRGSSGLAAWRLSFGVSVVLVHTHAPPAGAGPLL